jgi:hypothetical protein
MPAVNVRPRRLVFLTKALILYASQPEVCAIKDPGTTTDRGKPAEHNVWEFEP